MPSWQEFSAQAPELAALGEERMERSGLILLGTVRHDGTPRISPVEPLLVDGELLLGMMWQSKKALDLLRDPRCLVHNTVNDKDGKDGEFKLRGRAIDVRDSATRTRYGDALFAKINWRPVEPFHLFSVQVESAAFVVFGEGQMRMTRWPGPDGWTIRASP